MKSFAGFIVTTFLIVQISHTHEESFSSVISNPAHVNFHEIITNSLSLLNDDTFTAVSKDEDFHLSNLNSQFAEFQKSFTTPTTTTFVTTHKTKKKHRKSSYVHDIFKEHINTESSESTSTTVASNTTVLPTIKSTTTETTTTTKLPATNTTFRQKGVLDLLFPASRVRNFKNIFDTVRHMLSYTF